MHAFDRCAYFFVSFRQIADKGARCALYLISKAYSSGLKSAGELQVFWFAADNLFETRFRYASYSLLFFLTNILENLVQPENSDNKCGNPN